MLAHITGGCPLVKAAACRVIAYVAKRCCGVECQRERADVWSHGEKGLRVVCSSGMCGVFRPIVWTGFKNMSIKVRGLSAIRKVWDGVGMCSSRLMCEASQTTAGGDGGKLDDVGGRASGLLIYICDPHAGTGSDARIVRLLCPY